MLPLLLSLACTSDPVETSDTSDTGGPPCTPVAAVFFDLGETLVTEGDDGLFVEIPEAVVLLDALQAQGTPLGVITNVPDGWETGDVEALLADPSILDRFAVVLLSSQAQADPKPDPAIYAEAVAMLDPAPPIATTVFVTEEEGGLADADPPTEGAQAAGMIGVLVAAEPSGLADYTFDLSELASLAEAEWMACLEARQEGR